MSTSRFATSSALLVAASLLLVPMAASAHETTPVAAPEAKLQPVEGMQPPFCGTCGTVVAITAVDADEVAPKLKAMTAIKKSSKQPQRTLFEVLVRLNAGTQQIVTLDRAPQLTIGQRVRITNGVVVPDLG